MSEDEAYEKLQQLLMIAEDLKASGHYTLDNIKEELDLRLG